ncbi:hypothetical protein [Parasedimentitalea huanghaiensis]|uniref:Uncharacterized protein n=1 Tax=Parasedimentitalea huanghaiensis TaxID=2682100 RepID=A0A6L6WK79_9RHOB|nr:hypothetical protein [Zongyanglinia huanghaiensis]MVO17781.1 hypothetical protein [Zongyanglinia huanghaiensis]
MKAIHYTKLAALALSISCGMPAFAGLYKESTIDNSHINSSISESRQYGVLGMAAYYLDKLSLISRVSQAVSTREGECATIAYIFAMAAEDLQRYDLLRQYDNAGQELAYLSEVTAQACENSSFNLAESNGISRLAQDLLGAEVNEVSFREALYDQLSNIKGTLPADTSDETDPPTAER